MQKYVRQYVLHGVSVEMYITYVHIYTLYTCKLVWGMYLFVGPTINIGLWAQV